MKIDKKISACLIGVFFIVTNNLYACGPTFDDAYLVRGKEEQFMAVPGGDFLQELELIAGKKKPAEKRPEEEGGGKQEDQTPNPEFEDLKECLANTSLSPEEKTLIMESFKKNRDLFYTFFSTGANGKGPQNGEPFPTLSFPEKTPREFVTYFEGAAAYRAAAYPYSEYAAAH